MDFPFGRVAKWQTRWLQVPVFERMCGFKSRLAHQKWSICPSREFTADKSPNHLVIGAVFPDLRRRGRCGCARNHWT